MFPEQFCGLLHVDPGHDSCKIWYDIERNAGIKLPTKYCLLPKNNQSVVQMFVAANGIVLHVSAREATTTRILFCGYHSCTTSVGIEQYPKYPSIANWRNHSDTRWTTLRKIRAAYYHKIDGRNYAGGRFHAKIFHAQIFPNLALSYILYYRF